MNGKAVARRPLTLLPGRPTFHTFVTFSSFFRNVTLLASETNNVPNTTNMKRKLLQRAVLTVGVIASALGSAITTHAQSGDALLNKLVDKGVLSTKEANELRNQVDANFKKAYQVKSGMPDWVTAFKINGDLRLRYENIAPYNGDNTAPDRSRFRYRLRPGFTAVLQDRFEVGFRLTSSEASGIFGGDPISGNTSLGAGGSKKFIYLDLAYAKWQALNGPTWGLTLTGGKMENPFHFPGTDQFDKDYTPEGFAQELSYRLNQEHTLKLTGAQFILNEYDALSTDPAMLGAQVRWNATWSPKITSTLGLAYLSLINSETRASASGTNLGLTTASVPNQGRGNSRNADGSLVHGYNPFVIDAAATYSFESAPMYNGAFPVTASADYMYNHSAPSQNKGYGFGATFGKAGKKKTWQLDYRYTYLPMDAWYEEFTESDFGAYYGSPKPIGGDTGYRSGTNIKGHWLKASVSPTDALTLSMAYFLTDLVHSTVHGYNSGAGRLQVDAVLKF